MALILMGGCSQERTCSLQGESPRLSFQQEAFLLQGVRKGDVVTWFYPRGENLQAPRAQECPWESSEGFYQEELRGELQEELQGGGTLSRTWPLNPEDLAVEVFRPKDSGKASYCLITEGP